MFQVMHEQMYGSAKRRREENLSGHAFPSLSFSWICPSIEANRPSRLFDFMLKNRAICLLFDFHKYSQNASKSAEATLKGI